MYPPGQRRAAQEAMEIQFPDKIGKIHDGILARAIKGALSLSKGADTDRHYLISHQVLEAYMHGELERFIDLETGDYTFRTHDGRDVPANVFDDLVKGRNIY